MKKYCLYILLSGLLGVWGCDNKLNLEPISSITTNSFWKTSEDAEGALNGAYNQFRNTFKMDLLFWGEFRTGFWTFGTSGGAQDYAQLWSNSPTRTTSGTNWSGLYTLINDCNLILKHVPEIDFSNSSQKDEILGHAYFLRAFTYFWIARIWGDAPLALEGFESPAQELNLSRSSKTALFAQVKADIDFAVTMLAAGTPGNRAFFSSKAAANMLKADIYLWTAKREGGGNADLEIAKQAIDAVLTSGYQLDASYENVFRQDNNREIIFSIYYDQLEGGSQLGNQFVNQITRVPAGARDTIPHHAGPQWLGLSDTFTNSILKPESEDSRTSTIWRVVEISGSQPVVWINKYLGQVVQGTRLFTDDTRVYRFAEALLFKAEIENALGNTPAAINYLNEAVSRAYGADDYYELSMSTVQTDNAILEERLIEFTAEGKAWFDIIRFGKAFELIGSLTGRENDYQGNILYFPVAQDVMNRNVNINQTDGY